MATTGTICVFARKVVQFGWFDWRTFIFTILFTIVLNSGPLQFVANGNDLKWRAPQKPNIDEMVVWWLDRLVHATFRGNFFIAIRSHRHDITLFPSISPRSFKPFETSQYRAYWMELYLGTVWKCLSCQSIKSVQKINGFGAFSSSHQESGGRSRPRISNKMRGNGKNHVRLLLMLFAYAAIYPNAVNSSERRWIHTIEQSFTCKPERESHFFNSPHKKFKTHVISLCLSQPFRCHSTIINSKLVANGFHRKICWRISSLRWPALSFDRKF